jgi:predicted negative regulator of RcsB-dependent stress response
METYRTEEEQVEAIKRWWDENGRSTVVVIVLALAAGFGWQSWKGLEQQRMENASYVYQAMLESLNGDRADQGGFAEAKDLAQQLITDYASSSYAQFAALHLAKLAVKASDLDEAMTQLRWVLSKAPVKSDTADIAQLRLARVLAAAGDTSQALDILARGKGGAYAASYALVQGDIYMQLGKLEEANASYAAAKLTLASSASTGRIPTLNQKLESLNPVAAREISPSAQPGSMDTDASDDPEAAQDVEPSADVAQQAQEQDT